MSSRRRIVKVHRRPAVAGLWRDAQMASQAQLGAIWRRAGCYPAVMAAISHYQFSKALLPNPQLQQLLFRLFGPTTVGYRTCRTGMKNPPDSQL